MINKNTMKDNSSYPLNLASKWKYALTRKIERLVFFGVYEKT